MRGPRVSTDLDRLARWQEFGGRWRVLQMGTTGATVALCRCDGAEVDGFITHDRSTLEHLRTHPDSEHAP